MVNTYQKPIGIPNSKFQFVEFKNILSIPSKYKTQITILVFYNNLVGQNTKSELFMENTIKNPSHFQSQKFMEKL